MNRKISLLAILLLIVFAMFLACNPASVDTKDDNGEIGLPRPILNVYDENGTLLTIDVPLEFGKVIVGEKKDLEVTIANEGSYTFWSPTIYVYDGSDDFKPEPIAIDSLPPKYKIKETIHFKPSTTGDRKAMIRIETSYSVSPSGPSIRYIRDFLVTGTGVSPYPIINVYYNNVLVDLDNPVDFGNVLVGKKKQLELVVKNEGTVTLFSPTAYIIAIPIRPEWEITDFDGLKSLPPNHSANLYLTYSPKNVGKDSVTPIISGHYYNEESTAPINYKTRFAAIGNGVNAPLINVYNEDGELITLDNPLNFGVVGGAKKLEITVVNDGNETLQAPDIHQYLIPSDSFKVDQFNIKSLTPGSKTSTTVYFMPKSEGKHKTTFEISGSYGDDASAERFYSTLFSAIGIGGIPVDTE